MPLNQEAFYLLSKMLPSKNARTKSKEFLPQLWPQALNITFKRLHQINNMTKPKEEKDTQDNLARVINQVRNFACPYSACKICLCGAKEIAKVLVKKFKVEEK